MTYTADIHPDPHYKFHSSTAEEDACHRGNGTAGYYGAETTDCDTPFALVDETFKWIEENLRDKVDFAIWTGDSARHDSDERIPRDEKEVLNTNRWVANKFVRTFRSDNPRKNLAIPVIPTFGNNDILPHNILLAGPNKWLKAYTDVWGSFIPEEQRHGFERGGWFWVEVIPKKLAVFSLNTLYFFNNNAAVDGCALRSEPGYEHMEWLRIQLQFMRERGMKAILTGHVPPARTENKQLWDETCWQKYTLWLQQFRDVVLGGFYGHMNIDHFTLHDTKSIDIGIADEGEEESIRSTLDEELSILSATDYLQDLRKDWSTLPNPAPASRLEEAAGEEEEVDENEGDIETEARGKKGKKERKGGKGKKKKKNPLDKIGGQWGERYQVTHVGPSIVPNFFPTLRIVEYNISGLNTKATWANALHKRKEITKSDLNDDTTISFDEYWEDHPEDEYESDDESDTASKKNRKKHRKHKKQKKPRDPNLHIPLPPSKTTPPGPAYSPQSLTLLGYKQYFANLTYINNEHFTAPDDDSDDVEGDRWHKGKHHGKRPKDKVPHPRKLEFELEYTTFNDSIYALDDLTVRSYVKLARRIGQYKAQKGDKIIDKVVSGREGDDESASETLILDTREERDLSKDEVDAEAKGGHKGHKGKKDKKRQKHKKKKKQREKNQVWLHFIKRAFIGTLEDEEILSLSAGVGSQDDGGALSDVHDGEL